MSMLRTYFAHPAFTVEQEAFKRDFKEKMFSRLRATGLEAAILIEDPFLYTPNIEGNRETKLKLSKSVKTTCLRLLEECDVLLALVDFDDTGVAFEAGYAHCLNMPVVLISRGSCDNANAMLLGAAKARFDGILEAEQIDRLASMLEWYFTSKNSQPSKPVDN